MLKDFYEDPAYWTVTGMDSVSLASWEAAEVVALEIERPAPGPASNHVVPRHHPDLVQPPSLSIDLDGNPTSLPGLL